MKSLLGTRRPSHGLFRPPQTQNPPGYHEPDGLQNYPKLPWQGFKIGQSQNTGLLVENQPDDGYSSQHDLPFKTAMLIAAIASQIQEPVPQRLIERLGSSSNE